jgi:hypothetical protein
MATFETWDELLEKYTGGTITDQTALNGGEKTDIFFCPSDSVTRLEPSRMRRSYSMLFYSDNGEYPMWHNSLQFSKVTRPGETFLATEWHAPWNYRHYHLPGCIIYHSYWHWGWIDCYPATPYSPEEGKYHGIGNNYLFIDAHVDLLPPEEATLIDYWDFN